MKIEIEIQNTHPITSSDWNGFAGAEGWGNKQADRPVCRQFTSWFVLADKNGLGAYHEDGEQTYGTHLCFPTQRSAIVFLEELPEDFNPHDFGMENQS
jgi:hypothetical protein